MGKKRFINITIHEKTEETPQIRKTAEAANITIKKYEK